MAKGGVENFDEDNCASLFTKISPKYIKDRVYLSYTPPPLPASKGLLFHHEVEEWLSRMKEIQEDLIWLLELPYSSFWSHFAFDERVRGILTSYVQNTPRPYDLEEFCDALEKSNSSKILEAQDKVHALVLAVYVRLSDYDDLKETTTLLTPSEFGELIYEKFIFDIPTIYDICLVYGGSNNSEVSKVINVIFTHQELYLNDLDGAVICAIKALNEIAQRTKDIFSIIDCPNVQPWQRNNLTLTPLNDIINYLLDVTFSVAAFLDLYSPACNVFLKHKFESRIGDIYNNTVPLLYIHLDEMCYILFNSNLNSSESRLLKRKLRILREEMTKIFHLIVAYLVNESLKCRFEDDEDGVKKYVDNFLGMWYDCLAYDIFVRDYNTLYPAHKDILIINEVNASEVDNDKISFLIEAMHSYTSIRRKSDSLLVSSEEDEKAHSSTSTSDKKEATNKPKPISEVELQCRISSVCDILPDVEVKIIRAYLLSMDCSVEKVVDAILKDSIAGVPLTDRKQPESNSYLLGHRYNVFDGDEFDIMVHDEIDMSKVNLGKKKDKYKDLKELINDKSHRIEMAEMYQHLGLVSVREVSDGEIDVYDDEYDDTYDESDAYSRRSFVTPRVLREVTLDPYSPEGSGSEELEEQTEKVKGGCEGFNISDQFLPNPADIREKMEKKGLAGRTSKDAMKGKDVIGKPKGEGQDQSTQLNRQRKTTNKSGRANHNRKTKSMRKQQQGMF